MRERAPPRQPGRRRRAVGPDARQQARPPRGRADPARPRGHRAHRACRPLCPPRERSSRRNSRPSVDTGESAPLPWPLRRSSQHGPSGWMVVRTIDGSVTWSRRKSTMDYSRLDLVRRSATPIELDLVEAFANGRITRRQFIKRASVIGLSLPAVSAVIAACSPGTPSAAPGSVAPGASGSASAQRGRRRWHDPLRHPATGVRRPGRDAGPRRLRHRRPVVRVPVRAENRSRRSRRPSDRASPTEWEPNEDGTVWTFKLRPGAKWQHDGSALHRRPTSSRRWSASWRPATPASRACSMPGGAVATDPTTVTFTLVGANGNFPYLVSIYNAQTVITPADYVAGTTARRAPDRHRPLEARQLRPADGRDLRAQPGLVGRPDAARQHRVHLLRRDRADGHRLPGRPGRRDRPVRRPDGRGAVRRPELHAHRHAGGPPSPDLDARRQAGQFATTRSARRWRSHSDRDGAHPAAVQGPGRARQRPRHLAGLSVLRLRRSRSGRGMSTRPRRCWRTPVPPASRRPCTPASCRRSRTWPRSSRARPRRPGSPSTSRSRASTRSTAPQWCPADPRRSAVLRRGRARHRRLRPPRHAGRLPQRGAQDQGHLELVAVRSVGVRRRVRRVPGGGRRRRPEGGLHQDRDDPQRGRSRSACRTSTTTWPATRTSSPGSSRAPSGQMSFATTSKVA